MKNVMTKFGPYPGEYPQEPFRPDEPVRSFYFATKGKNQKDIYYDIEMNGDSDRTVEEYFEDMDDVPPQKADKRYWQNLTLQDIVDAAPPGAKLSDIVFKLSFPRYMEYTEVSFYHIERDVDAEEAAYQSDLKKYQHELSDYQIKYEQYQKDLAEYQSWMKEQEVKELEEKLAKLKK